MGFIDDKNTYGPIALPSGFDLTPEAPKEGAGFGAVLGAGFRMENPVISALSSFDYDPLKPFDPEYRPFEDIQGTDYEPYADRFVGARDQDDVVRMQRQIDRETEDRETLSAAGLGGFAAQMAAAVLSPSSLIPGGAIIKGVKGVRIGATSLSVGASAGLATGLDEIALHSSQQTRTGEESALAIGGSVILGGLLGAAAGKLSNREFKAASQQVEQLISNQHEIVEGMRSMGAADARIDLSLRGEAAFQAVRNIPIIRSLVRSDPVLRTTMSELPAARQVAVDLIETPLQFQVNDLGVSTTRGEGSVETRIKERERNQMVGAISGLSKHYGEYWNDGSVGALGTVTAPFQRWTSHLVGRSEKLGQSEFMREVGRAMRRDDKHPIPQVQAAADMLRREVFDPIKEEAIELGIFDADLQVKHADSYFTRVFNADLIRSHMSDGSDRDITLILKDQFMQRRDAAQRNLAFDRRLDNLENDRNQLRETIRGAQRSLDRARQKAVDKRSRAETAVSRDAGVGRATDALRRAFERRQGDLQAFVLGKEERAELQASVKDVRGIKRLRPRDILQAIRDLGGIKDPRVKSRWTGRDWVGEKPTDIEQILDSRAVSIRRNAGRDVDEVRELLVEAGYLDEDASVNDLYDAVRRAADGEDVFSRGVDTDELARYEAAKEFAAALDEMGVDVSKTLDEIIADLPGLARNQAATAAKAGEAGRSAGKAGDSASRAADRVTTALDRLEDAKARIAEIDSEITPKVRAEIKAAEDELVKLIPEIKKAQKERSAEEFYANATDLEIQDSVLETVRALTGLRNGEPSFQAAFASPTRARVLDVADEILEPWLEDHAGDVMAQYFRAMVPQLELVRKFGDLEMTAQIDAIQREAAVKMSKAPNTRARNRINREAQENIEDLQSMRDRMLGRYGVPANPRSVWVQGGRVARTVSYMGFLGGMTISAMPDIAGLVGRGGIREAFGAGVDLITNPKRLGLGLKEAADVGAAAEWYLNSRSLSLNEMFDPYGNGTRLERVMAQGATHFSKATGMVPWNFAWKSVGGALVASRMTKAADRVLKGTATTKDKRLLAANQIDLSMADRIARQVEKYGDKDGQLWLVSGKDWDDQDAFRAMRHAMNREMDMMIITPGQDKPLSFSTETGKFFLQFKSFAFSAHHRILLAGIQKADADVLAQFTMAVAMGGLVSNLKADLGGYDRKEGTAFWEDAIDRSGLTGWLIEPYNIASGLTGGATSISGQPVSRYQSRSIVQGALGPSVDMATNIAEATNAMVTGKHSHRDIEKLMRPIPGNNLPYLLGLMDQIEKAMVEATGARPER